MFWNGLNPGIGVCPLMSPANNVCHMILVAVVSTAVPLRLCAKAPALEEAVQCTGMCMLSQQQWLCSLISSKMGQLQDGALCGSRHDS